MDQTPEVDTDMAQFEDAAEFHECRATDREQISQCPTEENCPNIFILERRVDRHRDELNKHMTHIEELKAMVQANGLQVGKNSEDTSEILAIVTKGKNFFSVLDWVGTKVVGVGTLIGMIVAAVLWLRPGGKP